MRGSEDPMGRRFRLWFAGGLMLLFASTGFLRAGYQQPASPQRALINQYCIACHNERTKTGDLALDAINPDNVAEHTDVWEKVVRKLRARVMPPAGRPRPDDSTYDAVIASLEQSLDRAAAANPNPGRTETFRRLNRTEYQNAIRDLLALDVDVASLLPKDDANYGFDNVSLGALSATLLERYLAAAQKISRLAIGTPVKTPAASVSAVPIDLTQEEHFDGLPFGTRGGTVITHTFQADAEYEIQIRLMRNRNENIEGLSEPHQMELTLDGDRVQLFTVTPRRLQSGTYYADEDADKNLKVRLAVKAGPHAIGAAFIRKTSALLESERQPYQSHYNQDRSPRTQPAVYTIAVVGPFGATSAGDTPSRRRIFACQPAKPSDEGRCAATIISTLTRRAYRRAVTDDDIP